MAQRMAGNSLVYRMYRWPRAEAAIERPARVPRVEEVDKLKPPKNHTSAIEPGWRSARSLPRGGTRESAWRSHLARLVVVSNRVSVPSGDGVKRAGGLEVALRPALQRNGGVWLGWSGKVAAADRLETRSVKQKNVEYAVTEHWTGRLEYDYLRFASKALTFQGTATPGNVGGTVGLNLGEIKAIMAYKF